ncbi:MAG: ArsR family transcriptional regulator [Erythrobacter sp.]|uniref:VpaChn25_0724 family phage protein n=1 Tax=Erythrobacter sp. TaxID=1042 RepID=UPI0026009510|nr:ArsR family transcriptional regulator [Erythrobacter sp.]MCL9998370.1 ArsR family transcriptional regulator [Erythrobacter sp.]
MSLAAAAAAQLLTIQRLEVLQLLADQPSGSANDAALCEALNAMSHVVSRDRMRELLFWLQAQGALHVLDLRMSSGMIVATLTERGHDIARGRSRIAGVAAIDGREA